MVNVYVLFWKTSRLFKFIMYCKYCIKIDDKFASPLQKSPVWIERTGFIWNAVLGYGFEPSGLPLNIQPLNQGVINVCGVYFVCCHIKGFRMEYHNQDQPKYSLNSLYSYSTIRLWNHENTSWKWAMELGLHIVMRSDPGINTTQ